jgi:hypothetical protein
MAEHHVERSGRTVWPWLATVLAILTLVWVVRSHTRVTRETGGGEVSLAATAGTREAIAPDRSGGGLTSDVPGEVARFLEYVANDRAPTTPDSTYRFAAAGIRMLAAALESIAPTASGGIRVMQPQLDSMRVLATAMERDAPSIDDARQARLAFDIAGTVMQRLQLLGAPAAADEVQDARIAAWGVSDVRPLPSQRAAVQRFLDLAATAVEVIAQRAT